jgi:drug/metabolite transporter (DMT)-like permease
MGKAKGRRVDMKWIALFLGITLIVIGVMALTYHGITYTTREKVLQIGPIEATQEVKKTIPLPPFLGGLLLVGGVVLVILAARRS